MAQRDPAQLPELRGKTATLAIVLVIASLLGGSAWGYSYAGPLGGLFGVLLGAAIGTLAFTILRALASTRRFGERPAPDVRALPPEQAMQVLSAMISAGAEADGAAAKLELSGGLLARIAKAEARAASGDLDGALASLRGLLDEHPRSPAVPRALARVLDGHDDDPGRRDERARAIRQTLTLALRGGMNRMAGEFYTQLDAGGRARLELSSEDWASLAKILAVRGDAAGAAACRGRIDATVDSRA